MKRLLQILAALVVITIICTIALLAPRFRNMSDGFKRPTQLAGLAGGQEL